MKKMFVLQSDSDLKKGFKENKVFVCMLGEMFASYSEFHGE